MLRQGWVFQVRMGMSIGLLAGGLLGFTLGRIVGRINEVTFEPSPEAQEDFLEDEHTELGLSYFCGPFCAIFGGIGGALGAMIPRRLFAPPVGGLSAMFLVASLRGFKYAGLPLFERQIALILLAGSGLAAMVGALLAVLYAKSEAAEKDSLCLSPREASSQEIPVQRCVLLGGIILTSVILFFCSRAWSG
jgi:hypothetical protein